MIEHASFAHFNGLAPSDIRIVPALENAALHGTPMEVAQLLRSDPAAAGLISPGPDDLEDFFENGAIALHLVGADGRILKANKAELELLGYTAEEYVGRNIADFHADQATIDDILARLAHGEKLSKYPARLLAKDGGIRHVEITSSVQFRDGRFINTRCFTVDVTDLVRTRAELRERDDQLHRVLDVLPAAVYTTDAAGKITYFNRAAAELAGREPELGKDEWCVTFRIYTPDGKLLPHDQCPMAVALKEKRPVRGVEALAQRPDGTLVPFLPFPTPITGDDGEVVGAVNMLIDISERKQSETRQKMLLDELNHRVKNNMQMLCGLLETAQRDAAPQAQMVLKDATQRVAAMAAAQQVLYSSSVATTFSASDFLHAVCKSAQQAFDNSVKLKIEAASGWLANDVSMPLALILNELLTNAAKHGAGIEGETTITVGLRAAGSEMVLWVEDEGPGFDYRPNGARRSSGLGLVTGLTRQIQGAFEVERGVGARCIVRFPMHS
jgi:PAS domain S-box-containing protein